MVAVPLMNPNMVGFERKSTKIPNRKIPIIVWKIPAKKVDVNTKQRQRSGFSIGDTSSPMIDADKIDADATVPIATFFELPKMGQINGGTKHESSLRLSIQIMSIYVGK